MELSKEVDNLIAKNKDWRGETLAKIRKIILGSDPAIAEEWKYMVSPAWYLDGQICIGNIFKYKVQLVFGSGAALPDPDKIFKAGLTGKKWRYFDLFEGDNINESSLTNLVHAAISYNQTKINK